MPPVISIVGMSDTGKTMLIERLVPELKRRGYRVGTIKHDAHGFDIDHEGKDSYRHFQAGADTVVISSSAKLAMVKRVAREATIDEIAELCFSDVDIVITEGYKRQDKPKIEVSRDPRRDGILCGPDEDLIALVADQEVDVDAPRFGTDDVAGLADLIEERFLR